MKRIIISLSLVLLICFSFVSCGTEDFSILSGDTSIKYKIEDGEWHKIVKGEHIPATKGDVTLRGNFHMLAPDGEKSDRSHVVL